MRIRVSKERFLFGEYPVPQTRFDIPTLHVAKESVFSAIHRVSVEDIIGEVPIKNHRDTLKRIAEAYALREQQGGRLDPSQQDTRARIELAAQRAEREHQTFQLLGIDADIAFVTTMLSTWMRGSKWAKIAEILPEVVAQSQQQLPISFYNAMAKTGPLESTVNLPDMGHLVHMARLGKLLSLKGGPQAVRVIDEYDYLGRRPDLFNGIEFDNTAYRQAFLRLVSGVVNVSFGEHPEIRQEVFQQNLARFRADPMADELVRNRHMFSRGIAVPPDERLVPVTSYLEGSKKAPTDTLHTSLIERKGRLFIGLIDGYAPIHGVPLVYAHMSGNNSGPRQAEKLVSTTEIVREEDVFALARAVEGSSLSVTAVWTNLDHNVAPDTFLTYMLHPTSEAPKTATLEAALGDAMRKSSVTASHGTHQNMSHMVKAAPGVSEAEKQKIISKLPEPRE
jgi:hypothetical protein